MTAEIAILGGGGQLGRAWAALLGDRARVLTRAEADLARDDFIASLEKAVGDASIKAVVNAAGYTQVDKAEAEGKDEAMRVNGAAVGELAAWCAKRDVILVHYSTDYVFDGRGELPQNEDAEPGPLNVYGASKLAGERAVAAAGGKWLVFRTSWVYDAHGKNFFNTMLRLFHEKDSLNVVSDQVGAPTYAPHLAKASLTALEEALAAPAFPSGIYHLCGDGDTSWHGFAQAIFTLARDRDSGIRCQHINPIPSADYPTPARRPLNSRLSCSRAEEVFGVVLPRLEEGVRECFEEKYAD